MRKRDELTNPLSCMSRAREDEMTFVLLGRDLAATVAVQAWIEERIRLGKNTRQDAQIVEAERWIETVLVKQAIIRKAVQEEREACAKLAHADDELQGGEWVVNRRPDGTWEVVHASDLHGGVVEQHLRQHFHAQYAAERSPRGGVSINGKFYRGGQFIPAKDVANMTAEQKQKLHEAQAAAKAKRAGRGPVDVGKLKERLGVHAGELSEGEKKTAASRLRALRGYHGELTHHRLEELTEQAEKTLGKVKGNSVLEGRARRELASLHHMLEAKGEPAAVPADAGRGDTEPAGLTPPAETEKKPFVTAAGERVMMTEEQWKEYKKLRPKPLDPVLPGRTTEERKQATEEHDQKDRDAVNAATGFTGIDANGYRWENGKQVARGEEEGAAKKPTVDQHVKTIRDTIAGNPEHAYGYFQKLPPAEASAVLRKLSPAVKQELDRVSRQGLQQSTAQPEHPAPLPGAQPPVALPDFAKDVSQVAANTKTGGFGDNKVFINHVYREMAKKYPGLTLPEFKDRLLEANAAGLLTLSRADLVQVMNQEDVEESQTFHPSGRGEFNFILSPGEREQSKLDYYINEKGTPAPTGKPPEPEPQSEKEPAAEKPVEKPRPSDEKSGVKTVAEAWESAATSSQEDFDKGLAALDRMSKPDLVKAAAAIKHRVVPSRSASALRDELKERLSQRRNMAARVRASGKPKSIESGKPSAPKKGGVAAGILERAREREAEKNLPKSSNTAIDVEPSGSDNTSGGGEKTKPEESKMSPQEVHAAAQKRREQLDLQSVHRVHDVLSVQGVSEKQADYYHSLLSQKMNPPSPRDDVIDPGSAAEWLMAHSLPKPQTKQEVSKQIDALKIGSLKGYARENRDWFAPVQQKFSEVAGPKGELLGQKLKDRLEQLDDIDIRAARASNRAYEELVLRPVFGM